MALVVCSAPGAEGVAGSPHDFTRERKGASADLCDFCHVPQRVSSELAPPLWNRGDAQRGFTVFGVAPEASTDVSSFAGGPQGPGPSTRLCLGCHDGANGSSALAFPREAPARAAPVEGDSVLDDSASIASIRRSRIDVPVLTDHPAYVDYPAQPQARGFVVPPSRSGWNDVKLVDGRVECVSCHDVHASGNKAFLRRSNTGSAICFTCHRL